MAPWLPSGRIRAHEHERGGFSAGASGRINQRWVKEDSFRYFEKYGGFTSSLSRGGLVQAGDCACQWTIFCYIAFQSVSDKVCRNSLSEIFMDISQYYGFEMRQHNCFVMSNILLNNFCKISNLPSEKEPK